MLAEWKSNLTWFAFLSIVACAGCQKASETTAPTVAMAGPGGEKSQTAVAGGTQSPGVPSNQDLQHPVYEFETSQGKFTVRLDAEKAPLTVENFHNYVARGQYDSTIFHQVLGGSPQIVLGGGYTPDLKERATLTPIRNEAHRGLTNHRGTIAMARRANDEDSATCQFFFNIADNDMLNFKSRTSKGYGYCAFGEVIDGMEVLDRIAKAPVHDSGRFVSLPLEPVVIQSIRQVK